MGIEKKKKGITEAPDKKGNKRPRSDAVPLPAAVSVVLPSQSAVQCMSADEQDAFVTRAAELCESSIRLIDAGMSSLTARRANNDGNAAATTASRLEDTVLADMARLRDAPVAREFTDSTIWRRLRGLSDKAVAAVDAACADAVGGDAGGKTGGGADSVSRENGAASFKQMHLQTMTGQFADELAKLHEVEKMDGQRVQYLLRCLEEGANLFAGIVPTD
jgi:Ribosome-assembly protein 3